MTETEPSWVSAADARAQLPDLITKAEAGSETVLTRRGRPVARLVPIVPRFSLVALASVLKDRWGTAPEPGKVSTDNLRLLVKHGIDDLADVKRLASAVTPNMGSEGTSYLLDDHAHRLTSLPSGLTISEIEAWLILGSAASDVYQFAEPARTTAGLIVWADAVRELSRCLVALCKTADVLVDRLDAGSLVRAALQAKLPAKGLVPTVRRHFEYHRLTRLSQLTKLIESEPIPDALFRDRAYDVVDELGYYDNRGVERKDAYRLLAANVTADHYSAFVKLGINDMAEMIDWVGRRGVPAEALKWAMRCDVPRNKWADMLTGLPFSRRGMPRRNDAYRIDSFPIVLDLHTIRKIHDEGFDLIGWELPNKISKTCIIEALGVDAVLRIVRAGGTPDDLVALFELYSRAPGLGGRELFDEIAELAVEALARGITAAWLRQIGTSDTTVAAKRAFADSLTPERAHVIASYEPTWNDMEWLRWRRLPDAMAWIKVLQRRQSARPVVDQFVQTILSVDQHKSLLRAVVDAVGRPGRGDKMAASVMEWIKGQAGTKFVVNVDHIDAIAALLEKVDLGPGVSDAATDFRAAYANLVAQVGPVVGR